MIKSPEHIRTIAPYIPGKPIEELERDLGIKNSIKLASNENPIGPSPLALKAIKDALRTTRGSSSLNRYPDGDGFYLKNALAEMLSKHDARYTIQDTRYKIHDKKHASCIVHRASDFRVSPEEIILGNGSNELIDIAVRTFLNPGDEAVMADPSFVVYSMAVQAAGGKAIRIPLKDYKHDLNAMLNAVTSRTKILFIANPNNPTGTITTKKEFDRLMAYLRDGVLVVVDEAYFEYVTDPEYADSLKHFRNGKDILILRTFSKIYGLAGLRIGYGIAKAEILTEMNKVREPFNTNSIAQKAALEALKDKGYIRDSQRINNAGKKYLYKELTSLGIRYVPTEANFIYITDMDSKVIYESLLKAGVIVRPMGTKAIRVTIGLPDENKRFAKALKKVISVSE
ncbi:MAG: histidinol-phosphate transaminase [Nitrospirae bacterium]|nr:histidinol-phosphate transaminase [Nitrospirota bacterium]